MPESQRSLFAALGRVPSGLFILTVKRGGQETGMLASWVQQCSFDPPQVTIAIQKDRFVGKWLNEGTAFTINILDETQTDMISHFGRGFNPGEPAFDGLDVRNRPNSGTILSEALAYLDCEVASKVPAGDHRIVVGKITAGGLINEGRPMVHVRKSGRHY